MVDPTLPLPGLSPVEGKEIVARFDGGQLSSDGGLLVLREIEQRLKVAERLAACIDDPRDPASTVHTVADIIRFRLLMIAAGYEDGNDAGSLRSVPLFKLALDRPPSARDLCSQSTISRLENWPEKRTLLRLARALVELYCASFRQVPRRITLDIGDTFDAVHAGQQLRLFNAHYDGYGFQPIVVFDQDGRFVTALLRPAKRPKGIEIRAFLRRLIRAIGSHWPKVEILMRADSHYACPEVLDWCEAHGLDYVLGLAPTRTLRRHIVGLEESTAARLKAAPGDMARSAASRSSTTPRKPGAGSAALSPASRPVTRAPIPVDLLCGSTIVTNLRHGDGRALYQDLYCRRGQGENHIKAWKTHLAADRTSCHTATANQFRLFLHAGAYGLLWSLRTVMPRRSSWRVAQFDTLRLRLIKVAARIVEMKTEIKIHLPTSTPDQAIWHVALGQLPRLVDLTDGAAKPPPEPFPATPNPSLADTSHTPQRTGTGPCA